MFQSRPYSLMLELELFLPLLLPMSPSQVSFNEWFQEQFPMALTFYLDIETVFEDPLLS